MGQQRLRAVMACPDGDAVAGENFADIVGVDAVHSEGEDAAVLLRFFRAQHMDAGNIADALHGPAGEGQLPAMHLCKADAVHIVDGGVKTHRRR